MRYSASALSPVVALLLPALALADEDRPRVGARVLKATRFGVTCPVRDLKPSRKAESAAIPEAVSRPELPEITGGALHDEAIRPPLLGPGLPPIKTSFEGMNNSHNLAEYGNEIIPASTNVAVGPNHLMQGVNLLYRVYDKLGNPQTEPFRMSDLYEGLGGNCELYDRGDPIVLYDHLADRWVVTQFSYLNTTTPPYSLCIAVSQTGDPTGDYFAYEFSAGSEFPNLPMWGLGPDGYWAIFTQFTNGTTFNGSGAFAADRLQMLVGDPSASFLYFDVSAIQPNVFGCLPATLEGGAPPPGTPEIVACPLQGPTNPGLGIFEGHADFQDAARSYFIERPESPKILGAGSRNNPGGFDDNEQPATSEALDAIADRLMHALKFRTRSGGVQSFVSNFTVNVSGQTPTNAATYQAAERWMELYRDPFTGEITLNQEGTIAEGPGNGNGVNLWNGSAAQDNAGNILTAFSASGPSLNPSIWYTGRLSTDPSGSMYAPGTAQASGGVQTTPGSRWGDYSSIVVDPNDECTFWFTNTFYPVTSNATWHTLIANTKFPTCTPPPKGTLNVTVRNFFTGNLLDATLELTDGTRIGIVGGSHSQSLPVGVYSGRIRAGDSDEALSFEITENGVTTLDLLLGGDAGLSDYSILIEQCLNNAADPSETLTASLCYANDSGVPTADLTGVLYATGGVVRTPGPKFYGVIGNGDTVCRPFTFSVDPNLQAGAPVFLNVQFSGGGNSEFFTYPLTAGTPNIELTEDFEGVVPPALPAGFVASGGPPSFQTTASGPLTGNSLFIDSSPTAVDSFLQLPPVTVNSHLYVAFQHAGNLESGYDGVQVQVSTDGGATWKEWTEAGGTFESGGYNAIISPYSNSSLAGRPAWSGDYYDAIRGTTLSLDLSDGEVALMRLMMGTDSQGSGNPGGNPAGFWIDDIRIWDGADVCAPIGTGLDVDAHSIFPSNSNLNSTWEPGEAAVIGTFLVNGTPNSISITGDATNLAGPPGGTYTFLDNTANYGSIPGNNLAESPQSTGDCFSASGDCYVMAVSDPAVRPAAHWDATFDEILSTGGTKTWTLHVGRSFADVPTGNIFYRFIETIFHNSITGGCAAGTYCPGNATLRKQMAVFVLKAVEGSSYIPPPATGVFNDVPASDTFAPWIEELFRRGVVAGCATPGGPNYCPDNPVLRQQMAIFLLKTKFGSAYVPPPCQGIFGDIPCPSPFADWIEDLYNRAITGGCNVSPLLYCGTNPVTRGQMAVFLTKMFGLALYGP